MRDIDRSIIGKRFGKLTVVDLDHVASGNRQYWRCVCDCGEERIVRRDHLLSGVTAQCRSCALIRNDLTGRRFGRLTVLYLDRHVAYDDTYWVCECDCGNIKTIRQSSLLHGNTKSCGCMVHERKGYLHDLTGKRFGRWSVLRFDHINERGKPYWLCKCDCGTIKPVSTASLTSGKSRSCGCYGLEQHTRHGGSYYRLYRIWRCMINRCRREDNDNYNRYGGRGIDVCSEWDDFAEFQRWAIDNGYNEDLTIDRIDNNDGYCPENCRWVDTLTQGNNRTTNHVITYNGETHTIAEWSRILGIKYPTLYSRINRGDMRDFEDYFDIRD